jgi:hypothetical protein
MLPVTSVLSTAFLYIVIIITAQMIMYSVFVKCLKKEWEYIEAVHQLFIDYKKAYDSVRREVLYNILFEFGIPMKLVMQIEIC